MELDTWVDGVLWPEAETYYLKPSCLEALVFYSIEYSSE